MQRYFTNQILKTGGVLEVQKSDTHHMKNVMRFQPNDTFEMVDADKNVFICSVTEVNDSIQYKVVSQESSDTELPVKVRIICPLLKGEKFEWMLQKTTELGASEFVIYEADRSIVKLDDKKRQKRLQRYEKVVKEASEQSKRLVIPRISFAGKLNHVDVSGDEEVYFAYEDLSTDQSKALKKHMDNIESKKQIAFIFGPEGGFSEHEVKTAENFTNVRLGTRILRAETAPLYFLSAVSLIVD